MIDVLSFLRQLSFVLVMLVVSGAASHAAMDLSGFEKTLMELQRESAADPNGSSVRELLRKLDANYNPSRWISEVPSPDMASPSAERLERINQIARTIAPYESVLVTLGFDKSLGSDAQRAVDFLWYTAPSPALKQRLIDAADRNPTAYRVLFETGMFDSQVRSKFVEGLAASAPKYLREQRAAMAVDWGLVEALPVYLEMLRKPFDPQTISFVGHIPAESANGTLGGYRLASQAAMYLGSNGTILLPLLKQRYSEIQASFPDKGEVLTGNLKAAVDVLEGKRHPRVRAAINGRGALNLSRGHAPISHCAETGQQFTRRPATEDDPMLMRNVPAPIPPPGVAISHPQQPAPWGWIVGAIFFLIVAGVSIVTYLRK
jgi:hypothetical protein